MMIEKLSFTGTPEEFAPVEHLFVTRQFSREGQDSASDNGSAPSGSTAFARDIQGRTAEDYWRLLNRLPIKPGQQQVYKALYDAGETGLTVTELESITGRGKKDMPGIMGALGRRVNSTPGIGLDKKPGICLLFKITKLDNGQGDWHYTMLPELREALERLNPDWLH
jgi:hypothetical protein